MDANATIAITRQADHRAYMNQPVAEIILGVLNRAPQWIRHDLDAKDPAIRGRAEETLAAMIASALQPEISKTAD